MRAEAPFLKRVAFGLLVLGLGGFLAFEMLTAGMAGWEAARGRPVAALSWSANYPKALIQQATRLSVEGRRDEAALVSRAAVRETPMTAAGLRLLAMATEDSAKGRGLMRQAGRLSHRDVQSQAWLLYDAIASGDFQTASFHADMLLRLKRGDQAVLFFTLMDLLGTEEGRGALAARLRYQPSWRRKFLSTAGRSARPDEVGPLLLAISDRPGALTRDELEEFFGRLFAEKRYSLARQYWLKLVDSDASALIYDGQFDGRPGPPPLNWATSKFSAGAGALGVKNGAPPGKLRLRYDGIGQAGLLASETVLLPPGGYRIEARLDDLDPAAAGRFHLRVDCIDGGRLADLALGESGTVSRGQFMVAPQCQALALTFWPVAGERREPLELLVDSLYLRRVQ